MTPISDYMEGSDLFDILTDLVEHELNQMVWNSSQQEERMKSIDGWLNDQVKSY